MAARQSLYDQVVAVTSEYLGPAADRFVVRQIRNHLGKDPAELRRKDLQQLIIWIQLAMRLISTDDHVIDGYIAQLTLLAANGTKRTASHG